MADTVKLVIEIPIWLYEETKEFLHPDVLDTAIKNGVPLDDIIADIDGSRRDCRSAAEHDPWWEGKACGLQEAIELIDNNVGVRSNEVN